MTVKPQIGLANFLAYLWKSIVWKRKRNAEDIINRTKQKLSYIHIVELCIVPKLLS